MEVRIIDVAGEPVRCGFDELHVGDRCEETLVIDQAALGAFVGISGDRAPMHVDANHARAAGFEGAIVHGMLTSLRFSRLVGMFVPGADSVIHSLRFEYPLPVTLDAAGRAELRYVAAIGRLLPPLRAVVVDLEARHRDRVVVRGTAQCVMTR